MNISDLTLRDLEYVVAVAKHRHFGKASLEVHVSQPGLSTQIKKIEDVLGLSIFERTHRKVQVTSIGEQVVHQAELVLQEAKKIAELAKRESTQKLMSGTMHIGAISSLGPVFFPHLLPSLRKKYPELELVLKEGLTDGLIEELKEGSLDCVLASPTFDLSGLQVHELFFESFWICAPKTHPFSQRKSISVSEIKASEMVILEDGHCLKDQTLEVCSKNNRETSREFQATSLDTLRCLVACGLGYTIFPALAVVEDCKLKELVSYVPFTEKNIGRKIILVSRNQTVMKKNILELTRFIRETVLKTIFQDKGSQAPMRQEISLGL